MIKIISSEKIPIKIWANEIDEIALQQVKNLANLPFVFKHISLMADAHGGVSMPIGGVMATEGVILPYCVGVDISCGVLAAKTNLKYNSLNIETLKKIIGKIRELNPVGFNHHKERQYWENFENYPDSPIIKEELESAKYQLGTMGGSNHFQEIQKDLEGNIWIMIHSGSRNFGLKIANYYHNIAKELCKKWYSNIVSDELSFLPVDSKEGKEYFECMNYAMLFAKESRLRMFQNILYAFNYFYNTECLNFYDVHHNYARMEHHFGKNVMIHRKGATSAKLGEIGIIPGSQGSKSYIVKGLGNAMSFQSCSHGAGRKMSRKEAENTLDLQKEIKLLDEQGIIHGIRNKKDLDEAAGAYKDISEVMENQKDLVEIVTELSPIAVIKG